MNSIMDYRLSRCWHHPMTAPGREAMSAVVLICILAVGCRAPTDYRAQELPQSLRALANQSPRAVDLSALAQQSMHQNVIYPGDVLDVTVATGLEQREPQAWALRVTDTGSVDVPLIGPVDVAGLGLVDAENAIRNASIEQQVYRRPHVSVLMKKRRTIQVRVVGAVETPGVYALPATGSDLLAALVAAGGLNDKAGTVIEMRHPTSTGLSRTQDDRNPIALASYETSDDLPPRVVRVDLIAVSSDAEPQDLHVEDGTVVMVRERDKKSVSVIGLVRRPDTYELSTDEETRLLDALALAGGPTVSVADRVRVIRHPPDQEDPIAIGVSIRRAKQLGRENLVLAPGDIVVVEETAVTMVVETIRGFIRFGFTSAIPGL